ncbi:MAG: M23 family metallopeptidase [Oscillospiraceae bacterium]|nr:M23 family metallopeptidase [Oscillospiraceae bacterium]
MDANKDITAKINPKILSLTISAIVLAIAVAAFSWANIRKIAPPQRTEPTVSATDDSEAGNNLTGVPDNRTETQAVPQIIPQTAPKTEPQTVKSDVGAGAGTEAQAPSKSEEGAVSGAALKFALPLSTDIGADYSQGEMAYNSTLGDWRLHNGIDFNGLPGDSVKAVYEGVITAVYDNPLWGTVVEIDHGSGISAKYCGLEKDSVKPVNSSVGKGSEIGVLGVVPAESDRMPHLHFEITVNSVLADPLEVLGRN